MFTEDDKASLRSAYGRVTDAEAALAAVIRRRDEAAAVEERLGARIAEISARIAQPLVIPDADRVARLLAGDVPDPVSPEEVERQEAINRQMGAEKAQLAADMQAIAEERARITGEIEEAERKLGAARRALVLRFSDMAELRFRQAMFGLADRWFPVLKLARFASVELKVGLPNTIDYHLNSLGHVSLFDPHSKRYRSILTPRHDVQGEASLDPFRAIVELAECDQCAGERAS